MELEVLRSVTCPPAPAGQVTGAIKKPEKVGQKSRPAAVFTGPNSPLRIAYISTIGDTRQLIGPWTARAAIVQHSNH
ncbi:MAG: hypothetical protein ISN29_12285 [Gammaproteobacteria bacterium AqS3]|nr:hypothetical protein [Gammaproteobacteria bacterium AqS3]